MIKSKTVIINIADVKVPKRFEQTLPSAKKITNRINFYRKNECFDRELIVDENNNLIDGYTVYLVCKMLGIETIRGLKLTVKPTLSGIIDLLEKIKEAQL